jgi:hypothetical protein
MPTYTTAYVLKFAVNWLEARFGVRKWAAGRLKVPSDHVARFAEQAAADYNEANPPATGEAPVTLSVRQVRAVEAAQVAMLYDGIKLELGVQSPGVAVTRTVMIDGKQG